MLGQIRPEVLFTHEDSHQQADESEWLDPTGES